MPNKQKTKPTFGVAAFNCGYASDQKAQKKALVALNDDDTVVKMTAPNRTKAQPYKGATLLCLVADHLGVEHEAVATFIGGGPAPQKNQHALVTQIVRAMAKQTGLKSDDLVNAIDDAVESLAADDTDDTDDLDDEDVMGSLDDDDDDDDGPEPDFDPVPLDTTTVTVGGKVSMDDIRAVPWDGWEGDTFQQAWNLLDTTDPDATVLLVGERLVPRGESKQAGKGHKGVDPNKPFASRFMTRNRDLVFALFSKMSKRKSQRMTFFAEGFATTWNPATKSSTLTDTPSILTSRDMKGNMVAIFARFVVASGYDGSYDPRLLLDDDAVEDLANMVMGNGQKVFVDDLSFIKKDFTRSTEWSWALPMPRDNTGGSTYTATPAYGDIDNAF